MSTASPARRRVLESSFFGVIGVAWVIAAVLLHLQGLDWRYTATMIAAAVLALLVAVLLVAFRTGGAVLAELRIFLLLTAFFLIVLPIYWTMSHEVTGTVALSLTTLLALMLTGYFLIVNVRMDARPEDRLDGEIVEGAGELGFFPPRSLWPFVCASILTFSLLGPIFGWWMLILGFALGMWAIAGWVYEFYRGDYAH